MKGNVNPFEPWRPSESNAPPPVHASQPWRPPAKTPARADEAEPPMVLPAGQPRRDPAPKRPPEPNRPRQRPGQPSSLNTPVSELRTDQKVVLAMFFALGILGLVGLGWLGGTHFPRVFVTLLAVAAGFLAGISLLRRRSWYVRLGWMAGGLALAGLAGFFVPTTQGNSLWSAYQQVDDLRALPAGDIPQYARGKAARKELVSEFPTFADDVAAAEHAWFRRTVDAAIEEADKQLENDPRKASAGLQQVNAELMRLEHYSLVQAELQTARRRAVLACLKVAGEEVKDLLDKKQFDAVRKRGASWTDELAAEAQALGMEPDLRDRLQPMRRKAVAARLEEARKEINDLLTKDRFHAVADVGVKLAKDLGDEATAVGMADDLNKLCTGCAVFGDLARQAERH